MTSILTNTAAIAALQTLRTISHTISDTQRQVSTGQRVSQAADNAAYWSVATTMRSDNKALSAAKDAIGLGAAKVDTAYAGMESVVSVINEMKAKIVAATESGVDRQKVQDEIEQLKGQLQSIVTSASFSGENWLSTADDAAAASTVTIVASASRDAGGNFSTKTIAVDLADITLFNAAGTGILETTSSITPAFGGFEDLAAPVDTIVFTSPFVFNDGDEFQYDIQDGPDLYTATVNSSTVPFLGGRVDDMSDFWNLLAQSSNQAGLGIWGITNGNQQQAFGNYSPTPVLFSNFRYTGTQTSMTIMDVDVTTQENLSRLLSQVDIWLGDTTAAAAKIGALSSRINMQEAFVAKLSDSIDQGVGRLVDTDMNEASTRLKALQTQQQLATQSLSIANTSADIVLSLFRQ